MNGFGELPRTRTRGPQAARIGAAVVMALVSHGCIDGVEAPPETAALTQAQLNPLPPPGGQPPGGQATSLACGMLNLPADTPPPQNCYPLNCGAHCGAWETLCVQVEYGAMSIVPWSEFLSAIIGFGNTSRTWSAPSRGNRPTRHAPPHRRATSASGSVSWPRADA